VKIRLGITQQDAWDGLRKHREDAQQSAAIYRSARAPDSDFEDALVAKLEAASMCDGATDVIPAATRPLLFGLGKDENARNFVQTCYKIIDTLAVYHIVPPVYCSPTSNPLDALFLRLFELGALGFRQAGLKHSILSGHTGVGKTTMMLYLAT
jgi:hypothetical protein